MSDHTIFTLTSFFSLAGVATIGIIAYIGSKLLLPKNAAWIDRFTFIWLAFDAMIHFSFEGSFLYLSVFGRQVNTSVGPFAELWKEYAAADFRWGTADPTVVSLEILTVLGAGPMCCYILKQLIADDPARHFWLIVLNTAELYGGWMTFCPEWLTGSPNLDTSNALFLWVYLVFMNVMSVRRCYNHPHTDAMFRWVVIPIGLLIDSYGRVAKTMRVAHAVAKSKKA
ncbi:Emopamil binding protein-domain-containing protein [Mycena sp. CBHHK59/15]|nr:Emopamil binding protein-domain-containing protein [Mycena sp. CBHHK59/15]